MKIIYLSLFILFSLFAVMQYNDADAFLWIVIYGVVALISILRVFGIFQRGMALLLLVALGLFTLLHVPYVWEWLSSDNYSEMLYGMEQEKPYLEGTREFFGLLLADITLAFHLYYKRKL